MISGAVYLPTTHINSQRVALRPIFSFTTIVVFNFYPTFTSIPSSNVHGVLTVCQEFFLALGIYQQAKWGKFLLSWSLFSFEFLETRLLIVMVMMMMMTINKKQQCLSK